MTTSVVIITYPASLKWSNIRGGFLPFVNFFPQSLNDPCQLWAIDVLGLVEVFDYARGLGWSLDWWAPPTIPSLSWQGRNRPIGRRNKNVWDMAGRHVLAWVLLVVGHFQKTRICHSSNGMELWHLPCRKSAFVCWCDPSNTFSSLGPPHTWYNISCYLLPWDISTTPNCPYLVFALAFVSRLPWKGNLAALD